MQVVAGALTMAAGLAVGVTGWLGWRGRLPRNRFFGVRTAATMASDEAFRLGNRVAGPLLVAAGAVAVLGGLAVLAARSGAPFAVILGVVVAGFFGLAVAGGVLGARAAEVVPATGAVPGARPAGCAGCACAGAGRSCASGRTP